MLVSFRLGLLLLLLAAGSLPALEVRFDRYRADSGVEITRAADQLFVKWPISDQETGVVQLSLAENTPLFEVLAIQSEAGEKRIAEKLRPKYWLTVGSRNLEPQGWNAFFDNPPRRSHETFPWKLTPTDVEVSSAGRSSSIYLDGAAAGPFSGGLLLTFYPGCRLIQTTAVMRTEQDAVAFLYDAGVVSDQPDAWRRFAWIDSHDRLQAVAAKSKDEAEAVDARYRAIAGETEGGSLVVFPPPHQFLYPLDFADNFKFVWRGTGWRKGEGTGLGVRQPPEGDGRFVPWVNAPPNTDQRLSFFIALSGGTTDDALDETKRFTHGDRFKKLEGYRTFTSHYHIEHTLDYLRKQREQQTTGIPAGLESPPFVKAFQDRGIEMVHLAEFHVHHSPDFIEQRLTQLALLHEECRRLSSDDFLLIPGEEPNVQLGGHWISMFPRPVYWLLHPPQDAPFETKVDGLGTVYAIHSPEDVLRLMEKEEGLMWTAHARTKSSFGYPDRYRDAPFYKSDRFLGAAWKAMPADYSRSRLGVRILDLEDDMANWGQKKYILGEVDIFRVMPNYELYGHMNVNYLRLGEVPKFDEGWKPVVDALHSGAFFVSTGEVLLPSFTVGGKRSGEILPAADAKQANVKLQLEWTFPPNYAEVIWGDGKQVYRHRIDLRQEEAFGAKEVTAKLDLSVAKWVRLEAWDVAANGAFTQPVWIE
ncbi:hypothetical protein LOC68_06305 [Blastopirellula sp. JC732]|uniref:Uncharacterized protein n=1 Tax=Blastopirellula sediminis TaxID=2894196 RepID=A0A9X1SEM5_9BACT|nr:hypothetical protein [Blastopirellula sediminis]MCC9609223.1 hypothetical protein [Blastopirellula sediminis]MCC9628000.1 hypothetical protein [Blastopirellula sediminis]